MPREKKTPAYHQLVEPPEKIPFLPEPGGQQATQPRHTYLSVTAESSEHFSMSSFSACNQKRSCHSIGDQLLCWVLYGLKVRETGTEPRMPCDLGHV